MYVQTWNKYLSVLRILIKRAESEIQTFRLNTPDFDKMGPLRKTSYRFALQFRNGKTEAVTGQKAMANDLALALLQDSTIKEMFQLNEYHISMDSKFQLTINQVTKNIPATRVPVADQEPAS